MKRRTERRKREREQLPPSLLALQQLLPDAVDPRKYLESRYGRHAAGAGTEGLGTETEAENVTAPHHTDDVIAGKGLKRLLTDLNALPPQPRIVAEIRRRREEEERAAAAKRQRMEMRESGEKGDDSVVVQEDENGVAEEPEEQMMEETKENNDNNINNNMSNDMEEHYHFTGEDLWQITKRVPRSRSTVDHLDAAELCFALHQASCPVEIHARRQTEGTGGTGTVEGEVSGGHRLTGGVIAEDCPLLRYYKGKRFNDIISPPQPKEEAVEEEDKKTRTTKTKDEDEDEDDPDEEDEWRAFTASLSTPLPMTLRVHKNEKVLEAIAREYFPSSGTSSNGEEEETTVTNANANDDDDRRLLRRVVKRVRFVHPIIAQGSRGSKEASHAADLFGCPHHDYHANKRVEYMCRTLHSANAVSFQEVVSALPALVLDVQPHHRVIDMCAAPGSKTLHALDEMLAGGWTPEACRGVLIASEKDRVKATQTLPARLKRYHAPNVLCVRCDGTQWPRLYTQPLQQPRATTTTTTTNTNTASDSTSGSASSWEEVRFDRVICDVPCSGDGTVRKEPSISMTWSAGYVKSLVPTQIALLRRAVELLAVGGVLVYSTCSMNPKEDEEVVCAVLEQLQEGEVELVDVNAVLREKGVRLHSSGGLAAPEVEGRPAPSAYDGRKVLRVFPHRDNTGGFFVAALRKRSLPDLTPPAHVAKKLNQWTKGKLWAPVPPEDGEWRSILAFYGLEQASCFAYAVPVWETSNNAGEKRYQLVNPPAREPVPCGVAGEHAEGQLVPAFQLNPNGGPPRRIVLMTVGLAEMLFCTRPYKGPGVEVVSAGVRAFEKYDTKFLPDAACRWRATVEALSFLAPRCAARRVALVATPNAVSSPPPLLTSTPRVLLQHGTLLEGLLRSGHVWLSEFWPAVLLLPQRSESSSGSTSASGARGGGVPSLTVNRSLVEPGSPLEALLVSVANGETTVESATAQMIGGAGCAGAGVRPPSEAPSSAPAPSGLLFLDGLKVGGVVLEVRRSATGGDGGMEGEAQRQGKPWCLSATLSRSKLEVAVDGSLRAFGLMHFCHITMPIANGDSADGA